MTEPIKPPGRGPIDLLRGVSQADLDAAAGPSLRERAHAYAMDRQRLIDRAMWRMISRGQLFNFGWQLVVMDETRLDYSMRTEVWPLPPGGTPPPGCTLLTLRPELQDASGRTSPPAAPA